MTKGANAQIAIFVVVFCSNLTIIISSQMPCHRGVSRDYAGECFVFALLWVYVLLLRNEYLTIFEASFIFVVTRKLR